MRHFLLTAAGPDRPGLIAAVTKILYALGCNLEDSAMTRLQGEFAILLIFTSPDKVTAAALLARFKTLERSRRLVIHLKPMKPKELRPPKRGDTLCLVTLYGADRPGLVYRLTELLASKRVNVTDVSTHRTGDGTKKAGYILYVEAQTPRGMSVPDLARALEDLARRMDVTISVKPVEPTAL